MPTDEFHREIAKVERTTLGFEDHGIFTLMLHLSFGSSGQGAGGYALDNPVKNTDGTRRRGTAYGMEFIIRVMRACGVEEWSKIKGRTIYALREGSRIVGLEPLPTEPGEPFVFDEIKEMARD